MAEKLRLWPENNQNVDENGSESSLRGISSSDSSSHDYEEHPLYPFKIWINWLYTRMVDYGFYTPHIKTSYSCVRSKSLINQEACT